MSSNTTSMHTAAPKYRRDLDGLRAIAVLSVVAFHAFPTLLPGGFIGVDVFFVISGYLISSIIAASLENGSFGFVAFYSRRILRIFPALTLVLLVCIIAGWQVLLADEYAQLGGHIAAGAGFASNLVLWAQSGYFDSASDTKPLLHLWSLGIEEQFYILWPLLLWLSYKTKFHFAGIGILLLIISFAYNIASVGVDPVSAFYLPYCRMWELLIGALLAITATTGTTGRLRTPGNYKDLAAVLGLLLLAGAAYSLNKNSLFPGWWALLPTIGAALLISTEGAWINNHILSNRVFVWFGLISYPLYLWHWPLLSFGRIVKNGELSSNIRLGLVALSVGLAFLTYRYYERYLRHQGARTAMALFTGMCCVGLLGWNIYGREGLDFRYRDMVKQPPEMMRDFASWKDKGMYPEGVCDPDFIYPNSHICLQSNIGTQPDTVVFGDSHAFHAYWGIARAVGNENHIVKLLGRGGCTFGLYLTNDDCDQTYERQVQWMANAAFIKNVVVVHRLVIQNSSLPGDIASYRKRMDLLFEKLTAHGKKIIYLYSVPEVRMNPQLCGSQLPFGRKAELSGCNFPLARERAIQRTDRELLAGLVEKYPRITLFDPGEAMCNKGLCQTISNGKPIWMDDNHISESTSYILGSAIARAIAKD